MGYRPLEALLPKANFSVYKLVRMASQRAMELADGKPKLVDVPAHTKTATIALEEIFAGKVFLKEAADKFGPPKKNAKEEKLNEPNDEKIEQEQGV